MSDARFQSVHLECQPRRADFRAARDRLVAACGQYTIAGDLGLLEGAELPPIDATCTAPSALGLTFWLRDGEAMHPLSVGVNSVGRLPDNTIVLKDEHVSRRHCAVVVHRDGRCEVYDIASKNGTIVNGCKISGPTRLSSGDRISLCAKKLVFLAGDPARS